jgi:uncharacterized BrkB/YihY/UPF0761 family membrane protein
MGAEIVVRARHAKPLVIRAGLARTFGSLVTFLALLFLLFGLYLLQDNLENPIAAQPAALLAAAFSITLAFILFFYLLKPRRKHKGYARFRRAA